MGADYKNEDSRECVVVHVDIYSAIATNPTWSKLPQEAKKKLINTDLFKELIKTLDPDIVLYSSDKKIFPVLKSFLDDLGEDYIFEKEYYVSKKTVEGSRKKCEIAVNKSDNSKNRDYIRFYKTSQQDNVIIWGKNISKPFTVFDDEVRKKIIKAWFDNKEIEEGLSYEKPI